MQKKLAIGLDFYQKFHQNRVISQKDTMNTSTSIVIQILYGGGFFFQRALLFFEKMAPDDDGV